jgi:protein arginine kinase
MKFQQLGKSEIGWLKGYNEKSGIVISSRIRLARNLMKYPFPHRAKSEQQKQVYEKVESAIHALTYFKNSYLYKISSLDRIDRAFLVERHLISYEHSKPQGEKGVVFTNDERLSIMINEEDHLRIQLIFPGLSLEKIWEELNGIDNHLSDYLEYAYNHKYGFFTTCPTNTGTGLRASCLLHLPAIIMTDLLDKITDSLAKLNVNVRGFYGEGTKPVGDILQISNSRALGASEEKIISDIIRVVNTLLKYESEQREKIFSNRLRYKTEDQIYRSYATLIYAKMISSDETMNALSKVRLGLSQGLKFNELNFQLINSLMFQILPAHLQEIFNKEMSPIVRDIIRAEFIKAKLK